MEIETLTPRLVSTVAWFLSERLDGLLLMLAKVYSIDRAQNNVTFVPYGNRWGGVC